MADLRPGQYKRLGRIAENNPQRAEKVAARMEKRASRTERGKEVAAKVQDKKAFVKKANDLMTGRARAEAQYRPRVEEEKGTTALIKRMSRTEDKPVNVVRGKVNRPDTPLADSPVPSFFKSK